MTDLVAYSFKTQLINPGLLREILATISAAYIFIFTAKFYLYASWGTTIIIAAR